MNVSLVQQAELEPVFALYQSAIADMRARGLEQWLWGRYPNEAVLREDVQRQRLYQMWEGEQRVGVFALCLEQGEEYEGIGWQFGVRPACLHRIAVDPAQAGKGYARQAVALAKAEAVRLGCDCLRVDTYGQNERALRLFASVTLREAGTFRFPGFADDYHCFEVPLTDACPLLPVRMHPAYRYGEQTPWGGDALGRLYGKAIPDARTGEALEISAIPGLESTDDAGETLAALIARSGERLTGAGHAQPFPLLLKLLAARTELSVQVHPGDDYAMAHEGKLGKTEAWVILEAEPGAKLCYGLAPGVTLEALGQALRAGEDIAPMIATTDVAAGDVLYMPSGMVHAIGGGTTLYEIQQSSDVTYRLWDYNRVNERGQKRELHVEHSLRVIDPQLRGLREKLPPMERAGVHTVLKVPAFWLRCACVNGEQALRPQPESFGMLTALDALQLRWQGGQLVVKAGESVLLPAQGVALMLAGQGRALLASCP